MISVSVIIPNYNHAAFLQQRIESVLAQTFPPAEIIILDDASTDESRQLIERYRNHPLITHIEYNERNSGSPFRQWEKGIKLAKHDWIWIAESDDHCSPLFLEKASRQIIGQPRAGLFYCDAKIAGAASSENGLFSAEKNSYFNTSRWSTASITEGRNEIVDYLGIRCTINNASSTLLKKDLLLPCLPDIASFNFHGDWFSYLVIAKGNALVIYDPEPMNTYQVHSSGISDRLPADGRHRQECFRILSFICNGKDGITARAMVKKFILLNLRTGFISGFKDWMNYFRTSKKLALKVFFILLKERFTFNKKSST